MHNFTFISLEVAHSLTEVLNLLLKANLPAFLFLFALLQSFVKQTSEDETDTGEGEGHTTEAPAMETTKQNKVVVLRPKHHETF